MDSFKHSFKNTLKESMGLAVYNTGYQKCDARSAWGPALRDHYLVHYISAGKGMFYEGNRSHALIQGDMFLVYPGQVVSYAADRSDPWEYYWVGFHGTEAKRLLNLTGFSLQEPVLRVAQPELLRKRLLSIYEARGNTPAADVDMIGFLYRFMAELIRQTGPHTVAAGPREYVEQAVRFIQHNYAAEIGVEEIAACAGVSRSQLYRAFESEFGLSPHEFLQKYRIGEACSLLRTRRFTVAEVAGSVGFNDPLYFSRIFKKVRGMTPTDYQRIKAPERGELE